MILIFRGAIIDDKCASLSWYVIERSRKNVFATISADVYGSMK